MTVKAKGMNISKNRGITRLMNETDLVILLLVRSQKGNFKRRSDKLMNEDDRCPTWLPPAGEYKLARSCSSVK